jgi:hypothetical protein
MASTTHLAAKRFLAWKQGKGPNHKANVTLSCGSGGKSSLVVKPQEL